MGSIVISGCNLTGKHFQINLDYGQRVRTSKLIICVRLAGMVSTLGRSKTNKTCGRCCLCCCKMVLNLMGVYFIFSGLHTEEHTKTIICGKEEPPLDVGSEGLGLSPVTTMMYLLMVS